MTSQADYLEPLTPDNAAVLFIDNQTTLMLGIQSIDMTVLNTNTEDLAKLAGMFSLPAVLTTTGGGAKGPSGGLLKGITDTFPDPDIVNRMGNLNAMDDPRFAASVKATGRRKMILSGSRATSAWSVPRCRRSRLATTYSSRSMPRDRGPRRSTTGRSSG